MSDPLDDWRNGKQIVYPDGSGVPDAEDITMAGDMPDSVYVCTERNDTGSDSKVSRMSILRYNILNTGETATLPAVNEWDLTELLPEAAPNLGLEAITWISDFYLTKNGFIDESKNSKYDPDMYPGHGEGLFFVGLESNAKVYAFALDHVNKNNKSLVTDFNTELESIMSLYFDEETEYLWSLCDNTCDGRQEVYSLVNNNGKFDSIGLFNRPEEMPNINNEGYAVAPESLCNEDNLKPVFWVDDSFFESYAIRSGTVECGDFLKMQ